MCYTNRLWSLFVRQRLVSTHNLLVDLTAVLTWRSSFWHSMLRMFQSSSGSVPINNWCITAPRCSAVLRKGPQWRLAIRQTKVLSKSCQSLFSSPPYRKVTGNLFDASSACLFQLWQLELKLAIICKAPQVENNDFDSSNRHRGAHLHFHTGKSPKEGLRHFFSSNYGNICMSIYTTYKTPPETCWLQDKRESEWILFLHCPHCEWLVQCLPRLTSNASWEWLVFGTDSFQRCKVLYFFPFYLK